MVGNNNNNNNEETTSQRGVLPSLLFNETYADVHLRAAVLEEDNGAADYLVAANRCVLASRSPVFHSLLYGDFREASRDVIDIPGFTSPVLRSIVEYIYTDQPSLLQQQEGEEDEGSEDEEDEEDSSDEDSEDEQVEDNDEQGGLQQIHDLMGLAEAADYFLLPILAKRSMEKVASVMVQYPFQALEYFASRAAASVDDRSQTWRRPLTAHNNTHHPFQQLCAVVAVGVAANQVLDLPVVQNYAKSWCSSQYLYNHDVCGAFAVMAACSPYREDDEDVFASKVAEHAAEMISNNLFREDSDLIALANPEMVEKEIQKLRQCPYKQFQLLQKWAVAANNRADALQLLSWKGVSIPTHSMCHLLTSQRQEIAQELSKALIEKLDYIHQNELVHQVKKSGCVSEAQITRALQTQQVRQQVPHWRTAKSNVSILRFWDRSSDRFDCPVMRSGIHQWTVKVEACTGTHARIWLGVVRTDNSSWHSLWHSLWCANDGTLGYGIYNKCSPQSANEGATKKFSKCKGFRTGSTVTFSLDLREENSENGTLSIRVDNYLKGSFQTCFANLISRSEDRDNGFWPAANGYGETRVGIMALSSSPY